jgi:hypothetical protein
MTSTGRRPRVRGRFNTGAVAVLTAWAFMATVAGAASVPPSVIPGADNTDKTCEALFPGMETTELKVEPVPDGTNTYGDGTLSVSMVKPSTLAGSLNSFDWTSNIKVLGVLVKDGVDGANFYNYSPAGSMGDTYLTTPYDGDKGVSHISFCYKPALTAAKTASATYTRTYTWEIDKGVTPAAHVGFPGDEFMSNYTVELVRTVTDSDFLVSGTITVTNPTQKTVTFSVADSVGGTLTAVSCPTYTLEAGLSTTCTYSASLGDTKPPDGMNTATVTSQTAGVDGATATAPYAFGDPTKVVGYPTVNVTDSVQGALGSASGTKPFQYTDDFACPTDKGMYTNGVYSYTVPNRATIDETGQFDDASVTVDCYLWAVEKTALGSYDDQYEWDITKTVTPESQSGFAGDELEWTWSITWEKSLKEEINHEVTGVITVTNPAPIPVTVDVTDYLSGGLAATVDCGGGATSLTVPANGAANCAYSAAPESQLLENTATAARKGVSVSTTVDVLWDKGSDIGLDAVISDTTYGPIPADATQPFTYTRSHVCSTDPQAYADGNGTYSGSASNTATVTWTGGTDSSTAETTYDCYLWDVAKTADGTYNDRYEWDITKTVDPVSQSGFAGDTLSWTWSITWMSKLVEEINHEVTGVITVTNPAPMPLTVDVTDYVNGLAATVDCDGGTMLTVPANGSATCDYTAKTGSQLPYNTATATRLGVSVSDTVPVTWVKGPDVGLDAAISDSNNVTIPVDATQPFTYTDSHTCSTEPGAYVVGKGSYGGGAYNTATITWTGGTDSSTATTSYGCYLWAVEKTALGTYDDQYKWDITKTVTPESQSGFAGDTLEWTWSITWESSLKEDINHEVSGLITVTNPAPIPLTVAVDDYLWNGSEVAATVDCDGEGGTMLYVPAKGSGELHVQCHARIPAAEQHGDRDAQRRHGVDHGRREVGQGLRHWPRRGDQRQRPQRRSRSTARSRSRTPSSTSARLTLRHMQTATAPTAGAPPTRPRSRGPVGVTAPRRQPPTTATCGTSPRRRTAPTTTATSGTSPRRWTLCRSPASPVTRSRGPGRSRGRRSSSRRSTTR